MEKKEFDDSVLALPKSCKTAKERVERAIQKDEEEWERQHCACSNSASEPNPSDIEGKLEIPDNRERRDGPGGN